MYTFTDLLFFKLLDSNFVQGMDDLLVRSRVIESDALPFGGEDDEHKTGEKRHAHGQILEQFLGVPVGVLKETIQQPHVAESYREENHRREEGVHEVQRPEAEPPKLVKIVPLLPFFLAGEVEHVEAA